MRLKNIPLQERPRERLIKCGANSLSSTELIAILLSTGTQGKSVLHLAEELIVKFGTLSNLLDASLRELTEIKGMGKAKAIQLKAALALSLRKLEELDSQETFLSSHKAYTLIKHTLAQEKQEILIVFSKDVKGKLIGYEKVAVGTLSQLLIHPREVFYPAVRNKAYSFILAHNHPSGDPTPSKADLKVTEHLVKCSLIMDIKIDDHLIIGKESFVSLREKGCLA